MQRVDSQTTIKEEVKYHQIEQNHKNLGWKKLRLTLNGVSKFKSTFARKIDSDILIQEEIIEEIHQFKKPSTSTCAREGILPKNSDDFIEEIYTLRKEQDPFDWISE